MLPMPADERVVRVCSEATQHFGGPRLTRLGVTSSIRGEGRSTIAAAMGVVQGRLYDRGALLLDLDFERPGFGWDALRDSSGPGVVDVVQGHASLDRAIRPLGEGVFVLPAGSVNGSSPRLVREFLSGSLLDELQGHFEVIIADLPPLLGSPSGYLLASTFFTKILVVRAGATPLSTVRQAVENLDSKPLIMLNGTRSRLPRWLQTLAQRADGNLK